MKNPKYQVGDLVEDTRNNQRGMVIGVIADADRYIINYPIWEVSDYDVQYYRVNPKWIGTLASFRTEYYLKLLIKEKCSKCL